MREGWQQKTLDELCHVVRGGSPRPIQDFLTSSGDGVNWVKISDATASGKYIYETKEKIRPEGVARSRRVGPGDFLLSNSMSFGRPYIMRTSGCVHDGWLVLSDKSGEFDQDYLYHFLSSTNAYRQFDQLAAGSTVRNLNIESAKKVRVPLPPLSEQRRIVAILEEASEGIDTAIANAEKNLASARELFESQSYLVFAHGKSVWQKRRLGDVSERITKGSSPKWQGISYLKEPGILFVTSENVGEYRMILDDPKYVEARFNDKDKKSILKNGDVLTNIVGASIGRTAIFDIDDVANINQAVCVIRCDAKHLYNKFLTYLLNSPSFKELLHDNEVDNARANLSLGFFSDLMIPVPSIEEQKSIVQSLESLRTETEKLRTAYQQKIATLAQLKQAILQKAFAGELTALDPEAVQEAAE